MNYNNDTTPNYKKKKKKKKAPSMSSYNKFLSGGGLGLAGLLISSVMNDGKK